MKSKNVHTLAYIIFGLIIISLIIIIFSTNYHIVKIDTNSISEFSQEISKIDSVYINLNKSDLQKAISILEKGNISNDDLLKSLESQKETFTLIIVFLTLLIAAAGLFNIVQSLTSQSEQEKLQILHTEMKDAMEDVRCQSVIDHINARTTKMGQNKSKYYLESGKEVKDIEDFKFRIIEDIALYEKELIKINKYDKLFNNSREYFTLSNYIINSINYANNVGFMHCNKLDAKDNPLFKFWLNLFSSKMDRENFDEFKDFIKKNNIDSDINFGDY